MELLEEINKQLVGLDREEERKYSSNHQNPNKNTCCLAITDYFETSDLCKYLHTLGDLILSISKKHSVYRLHNLVDNLIVENARKKLLFNNNNVKGYILSLDDHVILLDEIGNTVVDTDKKNYDSRKIMHCFGVK